MRARASGTVTVAADIVPLLVASVIVAAAAGGCGASRPAGRAVGAGAPTVAVPARVRSNILRGDYAGSARCASCHAEITTAWQGSPMHLMTRQPEGARIRAPFDGTTFRFKDDSARLTEKDGARFVELASATGGRHVYRVTRVIGGRYREDFAGVEVGASDGERELLLPISYVFETKSFRLKGYSVLVMERPGLHAGGVWNQTCVFCHNTVPYFDDVWGALYEQSGIRGRAPGYQGEVVDKLLPPDRRFRFEVGGGAGALVDAVDAEVTAVGGAPVAAGTPPPRRSSMGFTSCAGASLPAISSRSASAARLATAAAGSMSPIPGCSRTSPRAARSWRLAPRWRGATAR